MEPTSSKSTDAVLSDGMLQFTIRRNGEPDASVTLDLLELKLACESCEKKHKLEVVDGKLVGTVPFFRDLATALTECGLERCTSALAWQVWVAVATQFRELKKSIN